MSDYHWSTVYVGGPTTNPAMDQRLVFAVLIHSYPCSLSEPSYNVIHVVLHPGDVSCDVIDEILVLVGRGLRVRRVIQDKLT